MPNRTPPPDSPVGRLNRAYKSPTGRPSGNPINGPPDACLDALTAIRELRENLMEQEDMVALGARMRGATWQQIADAMGTSRQAAHQRWGRISDFARYGPGD